MLECLQNYVPDKGADFLTYAHHFIGNALLDCRRQEEAGSFKSLDEYKAARGSAWLYNNSGKSAKEVIAEYAAEQNCTDETAAEYLTLARQNRRRVPFYSTMQDEDSEETGEDVTCDDSWNYADILWNGIRAKEVQAAFDKLSYKEQDFLERRNAICMNCGRVMPWDERTSFEKLSTDHEYSSTSGAERFYKRVVEKMTGLLLDAGVLGVVELKLTDKNKKNAAAAYEYKAVHRYANDDDEWGEIRFDFSVRTAQIVKLADGDLSRSNVFAKIAIRQILDTVDKSVVLWYNEEKRTGVFLHGEQLSTARYVRCDVGNSQAVHNRKQGNVGRQRKGYPSISEWRVLDFENGSTMERPAAEIW